MKPENGARRSIRLFRIYGIDITLDYSWFFIFFLVLWALSFGYFPSRFPEAGRGAVLIVGFVATLFLFASILTHELVHSLVAIRLGIKIPEITFFVFGGVSKISEEARDPITELKIAAAGPLSSFALAALFALARSVMEGVSPPIAVAVASYLSWVNIILGFFNLVPAFPLDGGRIFRALWWRMSGSLKRATRVASDLGKGFAFVLMILGGLQLFAGGLIGGLWFIFIGMFLRGMAIRGYQELIIRQAMEGVHVEEVMAHDVVSVPSELPVSRLISDYFIKYSFHGFPVVRGNEVAGIIELLDVRRVPEEKRKETTTGEVMTPLNPDLRIAPEASLAEALKRMTVQSVSRLLVMQGNRLLGMITKGGLFKFVELRQLWGK